MLVAGVVELTPTIVAAQDRAAQAAVGTEAAVAAQQEPQELLTAVGAEVAAQPQTPPEQEPQAATAVQAS